MKKHEVIIDTTNNFLAFWPGHYRYIRAIFSLSLPNLSTKIAAVKIEKDIIPQKIIKKGLKNDIINFF